MGSMIGLTPFGELVLIWAPLSVVCIAVIYSVAWHLFYAVTGKDPWAHD